MNETCALLPRKARKRHSYKTCLSLSTLRLGLYVVAVFRPTELKPRHFFLNLQLLPFRDTYGVSRNEFFLKREVSLHNLGISSPWLLKVHAIVSQPRKGKRIDDEFRGEACTLPPQNILSYRNQTFLS